MLLTYANLTIANSAPYNQDYRDIYYQPQNGFEESNHTFIHANHLPQRFANLHAGQAFCIGEIGFGSGLNALNTIDHFLRHARSQSHLHYCSVEKHPIELNTLKTLHQNWCQPQIRAQLYQQYPHNHSGIHTLHLHPRIHLHLLLGDAHDLLPQLHAKIDAWYLDGFAPQQKPPMLASPPICPYCAHQPPHHHPLQL
ncbi:tRNA (5-methylaminomethyl-2-thiouridine)(34)-methyltransferase MnmD [Rappaport israeli]|uniref:tRNA (5-methylaminomethyl-2-thiouridine)(34)-methyltransferase MnmD n=1 Tax=Rappaport israeli TaxID=1839807 RepID=UPI0009305B05|nr:tRNA (5-methylaminomethyl-2-thiouridine)(34)-methyltransferase MnmD [Rappaport israeli]